MPGDSNWKGHDLTSHRDVKIDGKTYRQSRCNRCNRDFVILEGETEWRPVHVGLVAFDTLDDETNRQWLSETCPGEPST